MDLKENAKVGIVAGSKSDQETVDKITAVLDQFGIVWEFNILSAHRTPNATAKYAREAAGRGLQVFFSKVWSSNIKAKFTFNLSR